MNLSPSDVTSLRACFPRSEIDETGYLLLRTPDTDPKAQWANYCELLEELRELGYALEGGSFDHDTIWGDLRKKA